MAARGAAQAGAAESPFYVVAEKILSAGESLRPDWPVAGTTGYGFLNLVSGLFIDGRHARRLRRVYARVTGRQETFDEVAYDSKRTIMLTAMASELNVLAHALESHLRTRPPTIAISRSTAVAKVLREVIACFPVYRTYISGARRRRVRPRGGAGGDQTRAPAQSADGSVDLRVSRGDSVDGAGCVCLARRPGRPGAAGSLR